MTIQEFGAQLLETEDLDPVYVALHRAGWDYPVLCRWLIAYWTFYDCGFACWAAERDFWPAMWMAAENTKPSPIGRWPRGRERRHMRGKLAQRTVGDLIVRYHDLPHTMVDRIALAAPNYRLLTRIVEDHVGFGPWIGFKVADMVDRVIGQPVEFSTPHIMFRDPIIAATMYHNYKLGRDYHAPIADPIRPIVENVVDELIATFQHYPAPPAYDRSVGLQEVETILCKWKSHIHGHYPPGNDIREISHGVAQWNTKMAKTFLSLLPR